MDGWACLFDALHRDASLGQCPVDCGCIPSTDDIATVTVDCWQCMQSLLHARRASFENEKNECQCQNVQGFKHMTRARPSPELGKRVRRQQNRPRGSTNELGHNHTADVVAAFHGFPKLLLSIARCSPRPGMVDSAAQKRTLVLLLPPATPANLATICVFEPAKPQLQLSIDFLCHETMLLACFLLFRSPND